MARIYYKYNPRTDNYERVYPSVRERMAMVGRYLAVGIFIGAGVYFLISLFFESQTMKSLREENEQLRTQYDILDRRISASLKVMESISERDDNFYRVMLQMEPLGPSRRYAGVDNARKYKDLARLTDASLITRLTRRMDMLDRQIYAQSRSFDELRDQVRLHKDKLGHIPSILPLDTALSKLASGFGYRRAPLDGKTRFHPGLDFAAPEGTPVLATGAGTIIQASWSATNGNTVIIDHGYNYTSLYSHLRRIDVQPGTRVSRGDTIGAVGSTGLSTGPHLHYEVAFKEKPQNPVNYYFMDISPEEYYRMIRMSENAGHVMD